MKFVYLCLTIFLVTYSAFSQSVEDCMECHADQDFTKSINDSTEISLYVDLDQYKNSVHGDLECIDCHSSIKDIDHEPDLPKVSCAQCHEDIQEIYNESIHGAAHVYEPIAATCSDCHGYHYVLPSDDRKSKTYKLNIENTCGACHTKPEVMDILGVRGAGPVAAYHLSVHSKILHQQNDKIAPTCTNCHGDHNIYLMSDPRSSFSKLNISGTCGKCHKKVSEEYSKSIHWFSVKHGHFQSPTCNDCHGEHEILSPEDVDAVTNRLNQASQVCAKCHSSPILMRRFGLDPQRIASYERTYHGLAVLKGSPEAASCTSCHEKHAIRSSKNPESSVYPKNLVHTCGKCHDNITSEFIGIAVHPKDMKERNPVAYYAQNIYIWLIIGVIGGMLIHNIIILLHYIRRKRLLIKNERTIQRFLPFEVVQHSLLIISFFVLVLTGFALKFPESGWVRLLVSLGMSEEIRSTLHRIAAVVLIVISAIQAGYFIFHYRGRREMVSLMPRIRDIKGFVDNIKFHLGLTKTKPEFDRFDYTEKAEYLALIWGTAVMAMTGLVLWFPEFFMNFLPSWMFEVSEVIHYFEAWLATLAIIIWHWFFVIYHPEKYPMSLTWMNGKITEEELKHHHPLEYEKLVKSNRPDMP